MNTTLAVAHLGLYLIVVLEALAICVLYHRNTELLKMAMRGGASNDLIGSLAPQFEAIEIRSESVLNSTDIVVERTNMLFVSSDCFVCQKMIDELRGRSQGIVERLNDCKLVIYCQGSHRGCARFLEGIDSNILILSEHETDVAALFSVKNPPILVEIEYPSQRIVNYTYPFSVDDFLTTINRATNWKSGTYN